MARCQRCGTCCAPKPGPPASWSAATAYLIRVGIDLAPPADYIPWSIPAEVDTTAFGLSAAGHEVGLENLTEAEKDALLEYLKLL